MKTVANPKNPKNASPKPDSIDYNPVSGSAGLKTYEVILGPSVKVTTDKKSKTRVVSFPFEFPDQTAGVLIICRVKDEEWIPLKNIRKITIEFNDNPNTR